MCIRFLIVNAVFLIPALSELAAQETPVEKPRQQVLIVTDSADEFNHRFVALALAAVGDMGKSDPAASIEVTIARTPPGKRKTDTPPEEKQIDDLTEEQMKKFHVIYLVDVQKLSEKATQLIESRVKSGAGLCVFLGSRAQARFYRAKQKPDGDNLFAVPFRRVAKTEGEVPINIEVAIADHPMFAILQRDDAKQLLDRVVVMNYHQVGRKWVPQARAKVICRLNGGEPLVIEHACGKGRVVTFLTAPDREWTNWPLDISWVVMVNELHNYLATSEKPPSQSEVQGK